MSDYGEFKGTPGFDEVTQMQIDAFAESIAGATQAHSVFVIVESDDALQCAMLSRGEDEAVSKMKLIRSMCMVAGASLSQATMGTFQLLVREPNGRMDLACPESDKTVFARRPRD